MLPRSLRGHSLWISRGFRPVRSSTSRFDFSVIRMPGGTRTLAYSSASSCPLSNPFNGVISRLPRLGSGVRIASPAPNFQTFKAADLRGFFVFRGWRRSLFPRIRRTTCVARGAQAAIAAERRGAPVAFLTARWAGIPGHSGEAAASRSVGSVPSFELNRDGERPVPDVICGSCPSRAVRRMSWRRF